MLDVIRTHPSAQGHGSERGLEAVHVKQKWAIVTLDERGYSTTPAKERDMMGDFCGMMGKLKTNSTMKKSLSSVLTASSIPPSLQGSVT